MNVSILGAEVKNAGRRYSPCGVGVTSDNDFITSDVSVIRMYNTDVFCNVRGITIPVYSNLADIPATSLPNRMSIKITDDAYPLKARWVNTNFRLEYLNAPRSIGEPIGWIPPVWLLPLLVKVACAIVVLVAVNAVICTIFNGILAWQLPGGVSGHEREITDTKKLVTYPDGSWAVYDTITGEIVDSGAKPDTWFVGAIVPIVLGVAGIAGIYIFVKYGMPAISRAVAKPEAKLEFDAG